MKGKDDKSSEEVRRNIKGEGGARTAGFDLIIMALSAWYVMAHAIFLDFFNKDVLHMCKPWIYGQE